MKYGDLSFRQTEALMNRIGGMDGLEKVLSGEWVVGVPAKVGKRTASTSRKIVAGLLEAVGEPARVCASERFVARDRFVSDRNGELPIRYLGEAFTDNFLGLVEKGVKATKLQPRKLVMSSVDGPIFSALGGKKKARIALAHVFGFLKSADRSRWFFFYVADVKGSLWAIDAYWRDHGWDLEAYSVTYPRGWRGGGHVVSR